MMTIKAALRLAGLFICAVGIVHGQQSPTLAIRAGHLIDVRSGKVVNNSYIIVSKDRILRMADSAPSGVKVIDLSKYTVVPGLIDSHAHVLGNPKDQSSTGNLRMSSAQKAIWGVRNLQILARSWVHRFARCLRRRRRLRTVCFTRQRCRRHDSWATYGFSRRVCLSHRWPR